MEELPTLIPENLQGESVEITAEGMGSILVTRAFSPEGKPVWVIYAADAEAPVEMNQ